MILFALLAFFLQSGLSAPAVDVCEPGDHRLLILGQVVLRFNVTEFLPDEMNQMINFLRGINADYVFSNVEFAVNGTYAQQNGGFVNDATPHIVEPYVLDVLKTFLINMWSTASNHAYDLGPAGIISTIMEMNARNMKYTGTGSNLTEAIKPLMLTENGVTWGLHSVVSAPGLITYGGVANATDPGNNAMILNTTSNLFDDAQRNLQLQLVGQLCRAADIPLSYHHNHGVSSTNGYTIPGWWSSYARDIIDAGASIYIGQGPTNLYPMEVYKGQLILYATGSFFFQTEKLDGSYPNITTWQGVMTDVCYKRGTTELKQVRLFPILMRSSGEGEPNSEEWYETVGAPDLVNISMALTILNSLKYSSAPFGTNITIDETNGVGYIQIPSLEEQTQGVPVACRRYETLQTGNEGTQARVGVVYCVMIVIAVVGLML